MNTKTRETKEIKETHPNEYARNTILVYYLKKEIEQLKFEANILKDCVSNLIALSSGEFDVSDNDINDTINHWKQAFETAGISLAEETEI